MLADQKSNDKTVMRRDYLEILSIDGKVMCVGFHEM
jgi:hypothetical protein